MAKSQFMRGQTVRQIVSAPIVGVIETFEADRETGERMIRVAWKDADGVVHSRHFAEEEIEALPETLLGA